jgi:hypothetical protein
MWNLVFLSIQLARQHRLDDLFHHAFDEVLLLHVRVVLGRQHDGVDAGDLVAVISAA